jgi:predicted ATPase/transcriptional regulator with XRE-family HTH domain
MALRVMPAPAEEGDENAVRRTAFGREVRDALAHLHDLPYLQTHPLAGAVRLDVARRGETVGWVLQRALGDALERLRPAAEGGPPRARRTFEVLHLRYVEGLAVGEVCGRLGISKTEYQREHSRGLEAVIALLRARRSPAHQLGDPPVAAALPPLDPPPAGQFGDLLRGYRRAAGLTQEELAARARVSPRAISDLERGQPSRRCWDTVQLLAEALHLEPAERARLEAAARRAGPPFPQAAGPRMGDGAATPGPNLPLPLTSFVGRERDTSEIKKMLRTARLVTLTGAGGCGKTRLALHLAADVASAYADGVGLVELGAVADPMLVSQTVVRALGLRHGRDYPILTTLVRYLRYRHMLLVLDNCEHLIDGCARLVEALLQSCPRLAILATSRQPLGIGGEASWRVPPLATPEPGPALRHGEDVGEELKRYAAVQLFVDRATAVLPSFRLTAQNAPAVARVCQQLDGMPLAIELAAAAVKALTVEQIARRLDDRFRLLTLGSRTALPRQQTLRATLDWSYDLLDEPEQILFRRLAVFVGGFTLEAAEAVCSGPGQDPADVLPALIQLVDKSLVPVQEENGDARYRLLETVRQYAWGRLVEAGEAEATRGRHRDWYIALVGPAELEWWGAKQLAWLNVALAEYDNLCAALAWCREADAEAGARLAGALWQFWQIRGEWVEGDGWLGTMLALVQGPSLARARALLGAAFLCRPLDAPRSRQLSEESLKLFREHGDRRRCGLARHNLGILASMAGRLAEGRTLLEESLADFRAAGDEAGAAMSLRDLGLCAQRQANPEQAGALYEQSLALARERGDHWNLAGTLRLVAEVAREQGEVARSRSLAEEALARFRAVGYKGGVSVVFADLGNLERAAGDYRRARQYLFEGVKISRETGTDWCTWRFLCLLGILAIREDAVARGVRLLGAGAEGIGFVTLYPMERADLETGLEGAQRALGEVAFAAAWAEGQAMTLEQTIAYALEEGGG